MWPKRFPTISSALFPIALISVALSCGGPVLWAAQQTTAQGPTNEKAQRTYMEGMEYLRRRMQEAALDAFKKADKQDGGHCPACQLKMIKYGIELGDWKTAETGAEEVVAEAQTPKEVAVAHYRLGIVLLYEGINRNKEEVFSRAHDEFTKALTAAPPSFPRRFWAMGECWHI